MENKPIKLNVGCGVDIKKGYINLDTHNTHGADLVHQLPQMVVKPVGGKYVLDVEGKPLPFDDNTVDHIYCSRMLEDFLYEYIAIMQDFHRVLKPGGTLHIVVPYGLDVRNPRHVRFFDETSFGEFCRTEKTQYLPGHVPQFKMKYMKVIRKSPFFLWVGTLFKKKVLGQKKRGYKTSSSDKQKWHVQIWRFLLQLSFRKKSIEVILEKPK